MDTRIEDLTFQSIIALAFMLVWLIGGFLAYSVLDGTFYILGGHEWTGSHAVYVLSLHYKCVPYIFIGTCIALTIFWSWHFFS
jgi:hypothetical protein